MMLTFLSENDNSQNVNYDDSTHISIIISSLLKCVNQKFVFKILDKVQYLLKLKVVFPSYNFVIIKAILAQYNQFLDRNKIFEHLKDIETFIPQEGLNVHSPS